MRLCRPLRVGGGKSARGVNQRQPSPEAAHLLCFMELMAQMRKAQLPERNHLPIKFRSGCERNFGVDWLLGQLVLGVDEQHGIPVVILARLDRRPNKTVSGQIFPQDLLDRGLNLWRDGWVRSWSGHSNEYSGRRGSRRASGAATG